MKKYGLPFIVIVISSLVLYAARTYLALQSIDTVMAILTAFALFVFGVYLNQYKSKRNDTWVKKFIVMGLFLLLLLIQTGYINIVIINQFLRIIKATSVVYYMLYIYFGYIFF